MPSSRRIKTKKHYHIIVILLLIAAATFFLYKEFGKEDLQPETLEEIQPEITYEIFPEIAVVIYGLGTSKKAAASIFEINAPLTLSIIPYTQYSEWIAEEGYKMGYDVIGHIPMEAKEPHSLGKGGLYTWMTDDEIRETLQESFDSLPHIKGISNYMGSAFTENERAMYVLISVLKEHGFFFLDSLTTPRSAGIMLAGEQGVKALKRDVFLDYKDNPEDIEAQWKKLVNIAQKKGFAITLALPRKNTIEFLKKTLPSDEVMIVPLSELVNAVRKK